MKNYNVTFVGRLKGAIGIMYPIHAEVSAENEHAANVKLYDTYEEEKE